MTRAMGRVPRVARPLAGILLVTGVLVVGSPAHACSCVPMDVRARLPEAEGAFVGSYVDRSEIGDGLVAFTFEVERVVKGAIGPRAIVRARGGGASCGLEFFGDRRTGLLLQRDDDGVWESGLCSMVGPSALLAVDPGHPPDANVAPVSAGFSTTSKTAAIGIVVVLILLGAVGFALISHRRPRPGPEDGGVA